MLLGTSLDLDLVPLWPSLPTWGAEAGDEHFKLTPLLNSPLESRSFEKPRTSLAGVVMQEKEQAF